MRSHGLDGGGGFVIHHPERWGLWMAANADVVSTFIGSASIVLGLPVY